VRPKVPIRQTGADRPVVAMKRLTTVEQRGRVIRAVIDWSTGNGRNRLVTAEGGSPRLDGTSRVMGDHQARICESLEVKLLRGYSALEQCRLELHPIMTRIIYCKDDDRPGEYEHVQFDFLGYTFQPRRAKNRWGKFFISFLPAISTKAAKKIRKTIRGWRMAATRNNQHLGDLARFINPIIRGWMNYYGRFYRSWCVLVLRHINGALAAWARRKFKRFRRKEQASVHWLWRVSRREPNLFAHWQMGIRPDAEV